MNGFFGPILALIWKDLLIEIRAKEVVPPALIFAALVVVIFNFAFEPTPDLVMAVAPGLLWMAFTFAGMLGINRSFGMEREQGSIEGLLLCPVSYDVVYLGKLIASFLFMVVTGVLVFPVFLALYNLPIFSPGLWLVVVLASLGFVSVGVVFSAMVANARGREILLPVLFLPIVVPVIIAAIEASRIVFQGGSSEELTRWIYLLAAFDTVFVVVSAMIFGFVLEE